jgi:hypothetical protein
MILVFTLLFAASQVVDASAQTTQHQMATRYLGAVQGDAIAPFISPHSVLHTPEGSYAGPEGPARFGGELRESFSNVTLATRTSESVGEYVVIEFTLTGIHTGPYRDVAPACAGVSAPGLAILHVEESGITQQWISYDTDLLLSQIDGFHQLDPSNRPDCSNYQQEDVPAPPMADLPPCMARGNCGWQP